MRITNQMLTGNMMLNINRNKQNMSTKGDQYATGQKIQRPSEDPIVAVRSLKFTTNLSELNQYYEKNIPDAKSWMDITESALDNVNAMLTQIHTYCDQGASDTLTVSDRDAIAETLKEYKDQIYQLGNSDYAGRYVFTGYRTDTSFIFEEQCDNLQYEIKEPIETEQLQQISYISGGASYEEGKSASEYLNESASKESAYRIRLAYDNLDETDEVTLYYRTEDMTEDEEPLEMTFPMMSAAESDVYKTEGEGHFIPETGELVLSDEQYEILTKATQMQVEYSKSSFGARDVRPEHYFECTTYELEKQDDGTYLRKENEEGEEIARYYSNPETQDIEYEVNFSQSLKINTLAKDSITTMIGREIDEIINTIAQVQNKETQLQRIKTKIDDTTTEEEERQNLEQLYSQVNDELTLWQNVLQEKFSVGLTTSSNVQQQINVAVSDHGARYNRLELTEDRLSSQQVDFTEMINDNDNIDMEEAIINYSSAQTTYNASLNAASKCVQNTLLDFL